MRRAFSLLAIVLLTPIAIAGTETNPEVSDPADQSGADVDLLAAWFENAWNGVRFTVQVRGFDESDLPEHSFFVGFTSDGSVHVASIVFDADGNVHTVAARRGYGDIYPTTDSLPNNLRDVQISTGRPATVSAIIPWGAVPGLEPGQALGNIYAGVDDGRTGDGRDYVDAKSTSSTFVMERALLGRPASSWVPPIAGGFVVLALVTIGALTYFIKRRNDGSSAAAPAATPRPNANAPSPPATTDSTPEGGPRVQLDPRRPDS